MVLRRAALIGTLLTVALLLWFVPESARIRNPAALILVTIPMVFRLVPHTARNALF
jgi:hypothetical protein